jgi:hypothetical protein
LNWDQLESGNDEQSRANGQRIFNKSNYHIRDFEMLHQKAANMKTTECAVGSAESAKQSTLQDKTIRRDAECGPANCS